MNLVFPTITGSYLHFKNDCEGIILLTAVKLLVQLHLGEASECGPVNSGQFCYFIRKKTMNILTNVKVNCARFTPQIILWTQILASVN